MIGWFSTFHLGRKVPLLTSQLFHAGKGVNVSIPTSHTLRSHRFVGCQGRLSEAMNAAVEMRSIRATMERKVNEGTPKASEQHSHVKPVYCESQG